MGTDIFYLAEKRVGEHWEPAFQTYYDPDPDEPDAPRILNHAGEFYVDTIPKLSKVGPPGGVRVVFHFCCWTLISPTIITPSTGPATVAG